MAFSNNHDNWLHVATQPCFRCGEVFAAVDLIPPQMVCRECWAAARRCPTCREVVEPPADHEFGACADCAIMLPPSLIKACCDPFDYAIGLRTGKIIRFTQADVHGAWVTLMLPPRTGALSFPRGVDVRIDDITWCADAPDGS